MGGVFSRPHERFPGMFGSQFWERYPYFLPCAIAAGYCMISFVTAAVFLKEVRTTLQLHIAVTSFKLFTDFAHDSFVKEIATVRSRTNYCRVWNSRGGCGRTRRNTNSSASESVGRETGVATGPAHQTRADLCSQLWVSCLAGYCLGCACSVVLFDPD